MWWGGDGEGGRRLAAERKSPLLEDCIGDGGGVVDVAG